MRFFLVDLKNNKYKKVFVPKEIQVLKILEWLSVWKFVERNCLEEKMLCFIMILDNKVSLINEKQTSMWLFDPLKDEVYY